MNEAAAAYFENLPEPDKPEGNPHAYVAKEFEGILNHSSAVVKEIKKDGNHAVMTVEMQGDNSIHGKFIGKLTFKIGFEKDETIINKITVDLDKTAQNILEKNKNITVEELKNEINKSLKEQKIPDYSKRKLFKNHYENKMKNHLDNQENYLKEKEKRKRDAELENARK